MSFPVSGLPDMEDWGGMMPPMELFGLLPSFLWASSWQMCLARSICCFISFSMYGSELVQVDEYAKFYT